MKCVFTVNVDVEAANVPDGQKHLIRFRTGRVLNGLASLNTEGLEALKKKSNGKVKPIAYFPIGTIYESPAAWKWCENGMAKPFDDECREAAGMTDADVDEAHRRFVRDFEKGIQPKDWALYDAGVIVGYREDGSYEPGPKWDEYQEALAKAREQEDDDE